MNYDIPCTKATQDCIGKDSAKELDRIRTKKSFGDIGNMLREKVKIRLCDF